MRLLTLKLLSNQASVDFFCGLQVLKVLYDLRGVPMVAAPIPGAAVYGLLDRRLKSRSIS